VYLPTPLPALVLLAAPFLTPARPPDKARPELESPAHELSLEVQALRTLYQLQLTPEQLKLLQKLARETAQPPRDRAKEKASKEYRRLLVSLRNALADEDGDRVDSLEEQLDELVDSEKPEVDDAVEVTPAARKRVPEVLRKLKPSQLAAFYRARADGMADPEDRLVEALDKVRGLDRDSWKAVRDDVAEDLGGLLGGLDPDKAGRAADRVVALLSKARGLSDEEYKAQRPALEKEAREVAGQSGPDEILRHAAERELAQLLSNPRLAAAMRTRLK
jgi:hypothetical protein